MILSISYNSSGANYYNTTQIHPNAALGYWILEDRCSAVVNVQNSSYLVLIAMISVNWLTESAIWQIIEFLEWWLWWWSGTLLPVIVGINNIEWNSSTFLMIIRLDQNSA